MFAAGGGFPDDPAAGAGLGSGLGDAVAANAQPVAGFDQGQHASAGWAGWPDDLRGTRVAEQVDEAEHRRNGCFGAGAGQQVGPVLQRPAKLLALPRPAHRGDDRGGDHVGRQSRVDAGDDADHRVGRVLAVGSAGDASWPAVAVAGVHSSDRAAAGAGFLDRAADIAVPVLAAALQGAQLFSALGADGCRHGAGTGPAQGDEQVADRSRRWRAAVDQQRRLVE
ncbi:hypothetical protein GCM10022255_045160 [Dactylosporangium darangshiense]|uniref:Uncharacterized protein n=1 Tax=Dactylosporangium darangshiense TaxID=579108 RepID=A0ABP8DB41_9ACTN